MRVLIFLSRRIQPFLSLVDHKSNFVCLRFNRSPLLVGLFYFYLENPVYRDSNSRPNVPEGYEVTSELPGRPAMMALQYIIR